MSATLPTGIPRLDALVRAEAERLAREFNTGYSAVVRRFGGVPEVWDDPARWEWPAMLCDTFDDHLRDLSRRESRCWAACALAEVVGVEVGETAPSWTYSPAVRDSVAAWTLTGAGLSRWVWCDYPADIEEVLGPPSPGRDGRPFSVRNLPTGWAESMAMALAAVCRDG